MKNTANTKSSSKSSFAVELPRGFGRGQARPWSLDAVKKLDPKVTARGVAFRKAGREALYERVRQSGTALLCAPRMGRLEDAAAYLGCSTEVAAEMGQATMPRATTWNRDVELLASSFGVSSLLLNRLLSRS